MKWIIFSVAGYVTPIIARMTLSLIIQLGVKCNISNQCHQ